MDKNTQKSTDGNQFFILGVQNSNVNSLIQLSNNILVSGGGNGNINFWDISAKKHLKTIYNTDDNNIVSLVKLSDKLIASGSWDGFVRIWDVSTSKLVQEMNEHKSYILFVTKLPNGNIASSAFDKSIVIWSNSNNNSYEKVQVISTNGTIAESICGLSDGRLVSTGNSDILVWNSSYQFEFKLNGHMGTATSVLEISKDIIASGSNDKLIKIWCLSKKECLHTLKGHSNCITSIILLSNGGLASCSWDKTILVWDLKSLKCSKTLNGHKKEVMTITELADGRIASGGKDFSILIWS